MPIVMNERQYIEDILKNGGFGENYSFTCCLLARYYHSLGCSNKEIREKIRDIINERLPTTYEGKVNRWIDRAMSTAGKYTLYDADEIRVSREECERIKAIHSDKFSDEKLQRLAFTLLCFAKFNFAKGVKRGWVNTVQRVVFKSADILKLSTTYQCLYYHELYKVGYVGFGRRPDNDNIRVVKFGGKDAEIVVTDINAAGLFWEQYCGKKFTECKRCKKMIPVTNGRNMYCGECAVEIDRQNKLEIMRQKRQKVDL